MSSAADWLAACNGVHFYVSFARDNVSVLWSVQLLVRLVFSQAHTRCTGSRHASLAPLQRFSVQCSADGKLVGAEISMSFEVFLAFLPFRPFWCWFSSLWTTSTSRWCLASWFLPWSAGTFSHLQISGDVFSGKARYTWQLQH